MTLDRNRMLAAGVAVLAVLLMCSGAAADTSYTTTFYVSGAPVTMVATAHWTGAVYHYEYVFNYSPGSTRRLTGLSIGNSQRLAFTNADTDKPNYFGVDPVYDPNNVSQNSILWNATTVVPTGTTITFSFDSIYGYQLVDTTATGGGWLSQQKTLGLIPEPGMLASLAAGVLGLGAWRVRRRRL